MKHKLLQAIDHAVDGQWNAAHEIVQGYDTDATAAWIHAVLHKMEGDPGNSRYWYSRAGQMAHTTDEPKAELAEIRKQLAASSAGA